MKMSQLTTTGNVTSAALSPDGKYVSSVTEDAGKYGIWLRQIVAPGAIQIVPPADTPYYGPVFSPDASLAGTDKREDPLLTYHQDYTFERRFMVEVGNCEAESVGLHPFRRLRSCICIVLEPGARSDSTRTNASRANFFYGLATRSSGDLPRVH
jgi:hypothetical protein